MKKENLTKNNKKKHPGGRPPKKESLINKKLLKELYVIGKTDKEVAELIGVTEQTINNWKKRYTSFFESLKEWKSEADLKVEQSLYKRAIGFEYDEITYEASKTKVDFGVKITEGEVSKIKLDPTKKIKIVTKIILGDVTAQIFWLKNRKPQEWRDKQEIQHDATDSFAAIIKKASENC